MIKRIMLDKRLKQCIMEGKFKEALEIAKNLSPDQIYSILDILTYENRSKNIDEISGKKYRTPSIVPYGFICYLIGQTNDKKLQASYNSFAAELLTMGYSYLPNSYALAINHERIAIELQPEDIYYKVFMLQIFSCPDSEDFFTKDEAIKIAKEILNKEPNNREAKEVLERYLNG